MIAKKTLLLTVAAALLIQIGTQANDIDPAIEFYSANKAANPIVLDGDLSEWTGVNVVENPRFVPNGGGDLITFEPFGGGTWSGNDDQSMNVQMTWNNDNLYLGVVVTDDYHEHARGGGGQTWNGDSLQLMVANEARNAQVAGGGLHNYALLGTDDAPSNEVSVHNEGSPAGSMAAIVRDIDAKTTTYEIGLPLATLGGVESLSEGMSLGLGFLVNDGDQPPQNGQKGWGGLGPHAIVFGKTPSETALVTLVPEPTSIGLSMVAMMAFSAMFLRRRKRQS